ncbi:uncharacterized protein LOC110657004 [Hevea brasiliensis]|uniref:uncharacterized protein LOC110657004 n=1 Tax=Hevea brasiliensis TaxID=3981 RepID=UPI0025E546B0|nr:uncharacterized protein LOC110657004 [Hevea brasiliensis]
MRAYKVKYERKRRNIELSMHDDVETSSFIGSWDECKLKKQELLPPILIRQSEKDSVNCSLGNLLTYPLMEEKVRNEADNFRGRPSDFRCHWASTTLSGPLRENSERAKRKEECAEF